MQLLSKADEVTTLVQVAKSKNLSVGFVPTMGALHKGHISLVRRAKKENDIVIVSIFVNPTQFNDKKDLEKYPRTLDQDIQALKPTKVDIVFAPDVSEIYPDGDKKGSEIDLGGLDKMMEGAFRPGHFNGVAQVVKRLLDIVNPDRLYMGQKDFQQFTIIQHMIDTLHLPVQMVVCPIMREENGLAMSSRNVRLTSTTRSNAGIIYKTLKSAKSKLKIHTIANINEEAMKSLSTGPFEPEYFEIVDGNTLQPIHDASKHDYIVACTAVWADGVRLIDNHILKS